ncbi:hypothetical protein PILCRDRAFT_4916 [Piloderma croceum F 1598]|uniref:Cleavage/polyadenylation specificity factor A subunit N-terminal domain-containing protein n=1 Tax=Piloderma croceum (strain F 1598) TaxID=765440 RepID=A0A0C3G6Y8_PILCF|nr:hypothetical protein PILCRDRAFT_4916 [Piloderma croceum F 1598]
MSASELRQKAVLITRLDSLWSLETVRPVTISTHSLGVGICRALILPGGEFILILIEDGTLQLYRYQDMSIPLVTVPHPDRGSCRRFPDFSDMRRTCNTRGETWAVIVDCYVTPEGNERTDYRAYLIDASSASIRLLTIVTTPHYSPDYHATGDILAIIIKEGNNYLINIRKIPFSADMMEEEAFLNLGHTFPTSFTTVLCPHMILVSTLSSLDLYQTPEFMPLGSSIKSCSNLSTPIAIHDFTKPNQGKLIWNALCPHLDGRFWCYIFSEVEEALLISPLPGSDDDFVRHVFDGPCSTDSSRAIGCRDTVEFQHIELLCFSASTYHDASTGYMRLGRTQAPDPSRSVSIQLLGYYGHVEDLSWDEESGRICAIYNPVDEYYGSSSSLLMIDMI